MFSLFTGKFQTWPSCSIVTTDPRGIRLRGAQRWLGVEWGLDLCTGIQVFPIKRLADAESTFALELIVLFWWLGSITPAGTWKRHDWSSSSSSYPKTFPPSKVPIGPRCAKARLKAWLATLASAINKQEVGPAQVGKNRAALSHLAF